MADVHQNSIQPHWISVCGIKVRLASSMKIEYWRTTGIQVFACLPWPSVTAGVGESQFEVTTKRVEF